jgi:RHS repeat-associated protein
VNIADKPINKIIYDSTGTNVVAQTNYTYDGVAIARNTASTPAPNHDYTNYSSTYNIRGNLTQLAEGLKGISTWTWLNTNRTYDDLGNALSSQDALLHTTTFDYADSWTDANCTVGTNTFAYLTKVTDALGHRTQYKYYRCTARVGSRQDENDIANGRSGTTFTYDLVNRPLTTTFSDGGSTTSSYTDTGNTNVTTTKAVTASLNVVKTTVRDGLDRISQTQLHDPNCAGGTGLTKVDYVYGFDSINHLRFEKVSTPYCNTPGTVYGLMTTTNHDALDRVTSVVQTDGSTITSTFGGTASGLTTTVTDEAGKSRKSQTDALGRLTAVWEDPSVLNYETDYGYNTLDNLVSVTQKGGAVSGSWRNRSSTYDSLGRLKCAGNPETTSGLNTPATCPATDTGAYTAGTTGYTYDAAGNLQTRTAPAPNQTSTSVTVVTTYSYDNVNRLTQKAYTGSPSTPTVRYAYDGNSLSGCTTTPPTINPADANPVNYRTAMCDGSGATSWTHDPLGRVLKEQRIVNGSSAINNGIQYTYYKDGELNQVTYPSGRVVTYTPNGSGGYSSGRVLSAIDVGNGVNYVTNAAYAPDGALGSTTMGGSIFGAFSYNSRLQPLQMFYGTNTPPTLTGSTCPATVANIMHRVYGFGLGTNDNGNVQSVINCRDTNRTQNFNYDALNRITQAFTSGPNWGETFTIDAWSNLTNKAQYPGKTLYESLNAAPASIRNQLNGYCHDAAGNMVLVGSCPTGTFTPTYSYDIENRLVSPAAGYSYVYDGDGNRAKKCTNAGCTAGMLYWRNLAGDPVLEAGVTGSGTEEYVFFNGKRVARRDITGSVVHYYFSDHLGSADAVTSSTGVIQDESDYYPYGGEITISNNDPNNYKFAGKERDSESSLDYFIARHYSSPLGRFMQTDPDTATPLHLINPQRWNMYAYALNNPLTYTDPDGRDAAAVNFSSMVGGAGHEGVMAIDSDGTVTYAEFGPASHGAGNLGGAAAPGVVNIDTNLPKVQFGSDHQPTPESMQAVKAAIAKNDEGGVDPNTIRVNYFQTSDTDTVALKNWMREQQEAAQRGQGPFAKYRVWGSQNCATFCVRGLVAGNAITNAAASNMSIVPNGLHWELLGLQQSKPLQEHVSHKICYTDDKGKKVCQ